jgi:hypothetical protein
MSQMRKVEMRIGTLKKNYDSLEVFIVVWHSRCGFAATPQCFSTKLGVLKLSSDAETYDIIVDIYLPTPPHITHPTTCRYHKQPKATCPTKCAHSYVYNPLIAEVLSQLHSSLSHAHMELVFELHA